MARESPLSPRSGPIFTIISHVIPVGATQQLAEHPGVSLAGSLIGQNTLAGPLSEAGSLLGAAQQALEIARQGVAGCAHDRVTLGESLHGVGEVRGRRADQDGLAQGRGFERVRTVERAERTSENNDVGEGVRVAQLADGVQEEPVGRWTALPRTRPADALS